MKSIQSELCYQRCSPKILLHCCIHFCMHVSISCEKVLDIKLYVSDHECSPDLNGLGVNTWFGLLNKYSSDHS